MGVPLSLLRTRDTHNLFQSFLGQDTSRLLKNPTLDIGPA